MGQAYGTTAPDEHGHVHTCIEKLQDSLSIMLTFPFAVKPTPEELRKLRLQFDDMRTSEGSDIFFS